MKYYKLKEEFSHKYEFYKPHIIYREDCKIQHSVSLLELLYDYPNHWDEVEKPIEEYNFKFGR